MGAFGGLILTNKGRALQAKAQTGVQLNFTKVKVGDGSLSGQSILELNDLISPKKELSILELKIQPEGKATLKSFLSNSDITTGFYWRELGVFAQDPDEGEILYCYGNAGENAEYIPAGGGADVVEKYINIVTLVGNASNVFATLGSEIYVTQADFNAHVNNTSNPHNVTVTQIGAETPSGAQAKADAAEANAKNYADTQIADLAGAGRTTETVKGNADAINSHVGNTNNPHNVTTSQIGAETPSGAQAKADAAEVNAKNYADQKFNDLAGTGRTTETVKENADNLAAHLAEKATDQATGHVQVDGTTITVDANGIISAAAGVTYYQTTEPPDKTQGRTWFNPDTGIMYVADGSKYQPIPPVQVLQEVIDFSESEITITHNNTTVSISNGSILLAGPFDIIPATYEKSFDVSAQDTVLRGMTFNNDGTKMYIIGDANDDVHQYSLSTPFDVGTAVYEKSFYVSAQTGSPCGITFNNDGTSMYITGGGKVYQYSLSTPFDVGTSAYEKSIDVSAQDTYLTGVAFNNDGSKMYILGTNNRSVYQYSLLSSPALSGTAIIEWNSHPADIKAWDLVTYQITPDGETVTVDIQESADGGSTWVDAFTNIDQNFDISTIDPTHLVRFKVNLSRVDTANNPTVDYLARRFVR